jgi:hypothetical protein
MNLNGILIVTGIVIGLIIISYRFRKGIQLTIIRMIFGAYSYEYLNIFKKYFVRSPYQYCFRDDFISHLLFVLSKKANIPSYKSAKDIHFENTPYALKYKELLRTKGKPDCFNAFRFYNPQFEIKAVGYHNNIGGSKAVMVYYFMDDLFFMGEYIFKNPRTDVKSSLIGHFLDTKGIAEENFYIENSKDRIIHYQNTGFTIDIKYLSREDQTIIDNLEAYHKMVTGKKLEVEEL